MLDRVAARHWAWATALSVGLAAGCAEPGRRTGAPPADASKAPVAKQTPTPKPVQPQAQPQPAPQPQVTPAKPQEGQPAAKTDKPAQDRPFAAKVDAERTPVTIPEPPTDRPMTDAERDALEEMIRAAVQAGQTKVIEEGAKDQAAPAATPAAQPAGEGKEAGCAGGTTIQKVDLTPPPPDQPQPKFVCKEPKVKLDGVWQGKPAEFKFHIGNDGQAPLAIRLKGG